MLFRVTRKSFRDIYNVIKDHPVFARRKYKPAKPAWHQLLVYLYRVGREGDSGCTTMISTFFRISYGSVQNYVDNVVTALQSLKPQYLRWHTNEEKQEMRVRCGVAYVGLWMEHLFF